MCSYKNIITILTTLGISSITLAAPIDVNSLAAIAKAKAVSIVNDDYKGVFDNGYIDGHDNLYLMNHGYFPRSNVSRFLNAEIVNKKSLYLECIVNSNNKPDSTKTIETVNPYSDSISNRCFQENYLNSVVPELTNGQKAAGFLAWLFKGFLEVLGDKPQYKAISNIEYGHDESSVEKVKKIFSGTPKSTIILKSKDQKEIIYGKFILNDYKDTETLALLLYKANLEKRIGIFVPNPARTTSSSVELENIIHFVILTEKPESNFFNDEELKNLNGEH